MRKLIFLLMFITVFALVGCGKDTNNSADGTETASAEETTETTNKNDDSENKVDDNESMGDSIEGAEEAGLTGSPKVLNFGTVEESSFLQFSIERAGIERALYPSDTSGYYSYMPEEEGQEYFYLTGTLKNISGNEYDVEKMSANFCFDNKYNYDGWLLADGGYNFEGNDVTPLTSVTYYIYTKIPNELVNTYKTCTVTFGMEENFNEDEYNYAHLDKCDYVYQITVNK